MKAIFKREFKAYFSSPIGYIFLAAVWMIGGYNFATAYSYGMPVVNQVMISVSWIVLLVMAVIVMRTFSEDRGKKVDQLLLTAPVRLSGIVFGKFFAALSVYAIGLAPTLIYQMIMVSEMKKVDTVLGWKSYWYALLGMLLFGAALISLGMFISSLTESTALAGIVTEVVNLLILFMPSFSESMKEKLESLTQTAKKSFNLGASVLKILQKCADGISFADRLENFATEVFSVADVIYLLSFTVVFLFLCFRSLEKRRWS